MDEISRARSDTVPAVDENSRRVVDHDSLVTVRLSEPLYLHVNTNIAPNVLPSRKSLCGNEHTPSDAVAEAVKEKEEGIEDLQEPVEYETTKSPATTVSDHSRSLQDELGEDDLPDDTDSIHSTLDDADITQQESNDTSVISHPRSSEETNWDQLQEIEDQESKDQFLQNVS